MQRMWFVLLLACFTAVLWFTGCEPPMGGQSESTYANTLQYQLATGPAPEMAALLADQGLTLVDSVTCTDPKSGKAYTGYLAVFEGYFSEGTNAAGQHVGPLPKHCLVLTGSSYCMGYQMGYLRPAETQLMAVSFLDKAAEALLKIKRDDFPEIYDFLKNEVRKLCEGARPVIPDYLEEEMAGMAAGATAHGYAIDARDVILMNEGFDALYAILSTGVLPSFQEFVDLITGKRSQLVAANQTDALKQLDTKIRVTGARVLFPSADPYILGCNEFVVSGNATGSDAVYHGRDFMFPTGDIYQDVSCAVVYMPEEDYPFIAITAPGFVGHPTALNSQGLSMGMDVVLGACSRPTPGMGSLFVLRDIVQHCNNLDQAIARMKDMDRGVSWLYVIADDEHSASYTNGVVVEEGRSDPPFTGPDRMPIWNQILLWPLIVKLKGQPLPERGMLMRSQEWLYPETFKCVNIGFPNGNDINYLIYFPDQNETWPDVVVAANNYIIPRMVFTTFNPRIDRIGGSINKATLTFRYNKMVELIGNDYGHVNYAKAREIIDFLNPNRGIDPLKRYNIGGPVAGHHALIDNKAQTVEALFGYYGDWQNGVADPWIMLDLKPFAAWHRAVRGVNWVSGLDS